MNKDFSEKKLLDMTTEKQVRVLYELASFIEANSYDNESSHFIKLTKYHTFLKNSSVDRIQKLNKEFIKIKTLDYQFQIYLMNLERLLGQSKKEYDFLVNTGDKSNTSIKTFPIKCLLDSVRSAHNVGAAFRNAECFGVEEVLLCGLSPTPENIQVKKTAMGCDELVSWQYHRDTIELVTGLKKAGHTIWSIETATNAVSLNEINQIPEKLVLIFGHEQFGVSYELLELSDRTISIDLHGKKNSLNVSVSQAVVLSTVVNLSV
jgi:tRNA G18 (ribose-2'-O)-methylase SpoU